MKRYTYFSVGLLCLSLLVTSGRAASIVITCDNKYTLYLNGPFIGVQDNDDGVSGWDVAETWNVTLLPGKNVIAVGCGDWSVNHYCHNGQGLIAEIQLDDGTVEVTDTSWRVTTLPANGWRWPDFDDSGWQFAEVCGATWDAEPWSLHWNELDVFSQHGAKWIWLGPFTSPPDCEALHSDEPNVNFRFTFYYTPSVPIDEATWGDIKALYR